MAPLLATVSVVSPPLLKVTPVPPTGTIVHKRLAALPKPATFTVKLILVPFTSVVKLPTTFTAAGVPCTGVAQPVKVTLQEMLLKEYFVVEG